MAEPVKPKVFTAWITKYALTGGIACEQVEQSENFPNMCSPVDTYRTFYGEGKNWHRTEAAAKVRAEQMRVERIASLKKQIKKLEGMKF